MYEPRHHPLHLFAVNLFLFIGAYSKQGFFIFVSVALYIMTKYIQTPQAFYRWP